MMRNTPDQRYRRAVIDLAGGMDTLMLLRENVLNERSYAALASQRGIHKTTVKRRCDAMRERLVACGLYTDLVMSWD